MSISLSKKEKWFIFISVLLLVGLLAGGYFLILSPKQSQVMIKEKQVKSQEKILSVLQTQDTPSSTVTKESAATLQKQVPVKPQTEQLLLDIEKAEVASGSFVTDMQFNEEEAKDQTAIEQRVDSQLNGDATANQTADSNTKTNKESKNIMPEGLKKETVDLTIEATGYGELETFINVLEKSERIITVDSIDFTANDEIISDDQTDQLIKFTVKISAFYMPTLTDLINQLPKLETPEPADKKDPFSSFGMYSPNRVEGNVYSITKDPPQPQDNTDTTTPEIPDAIQTPDIPNVVDENKGNQTETENTVEKDGKQYKVVSYKVQLGDTIFALAVRYYNSNKGMKLIMDWNHLQIPRRLLAGTTIQIPIPVDGEI